ncbi:cysteine hydrolase family protein [Aquabacter spiritensis]|uniref:Nicotinamidase-related amidase n=1 Tax=Aquabacter spiritensis TaxID=933073 RepID=A0A4R3LT61_9HYPH|nr:cysteine hydrolase [Aquabacter spiritensis]TCT03581.1 nicotinamidase-related amidase [Aquabacter spiritensis]
MAPLLDRSSMITRMRDALRLEAERTIVLTIDCQRGNLEPALASLPVPAPECARVIAGTNRLLALGRRHALPIVHLTTVFEACLLGTHPFEKAMLDLKESFSPGQTSDFKRHKSPGSKEAEFVDDLDVRPEDLIVDGKRTFDGFEGTPLDRLLRAMGRDTLLIAGCNTNTCVLSTTFGAYNRGYRAVVISDCVASAYGEDLHAFALSNIQRRLGWVLDLGELEDKLAA